MKEIESLKKILPSIVDVRKLFFCFILYRYVMKLLIGKHNALTKTFLSPFEIIFLPDT